MAGVRRSEGPLKGGTAVFIFTITSMLVKHCSDGTVEGQRIYVLWHGLQSLSVLQYFSIILAPLFHNLVMYLFMYTSALL